MDSIDQIRKKKHEAWLLSQNSPLRSVESKPASSSSAMASSLIMNSSTDASVMPTGDEEDDDDEIEVVKVVQHSLPCPSSQNDECVIIDVKPISFKTGTATPCIDAKYDSLKPRSSQEHKEDFLKPVIHPNFSIVSYNIWVGRGCDGAPYAYERMYRIASLILSASPRPLFIGLQEVTQSTQPMLFPLLQSAGYHMYCQENVSYGCAIGVLVRPCNPQTGKEEKTSLRVQVVEQKFQYFAKTNQGRGLMLVHAKIWNQNWSMDVVFTTMHLESYKRDWRAGTEYKGVGERHSQIRQVIQYIDDYVEKWNGRHPGAASIRMAIISGDLNTDEKSRVSDGVDLNLLEYIHGMTRSKWLDAWLETMPQHQDSDGFTYDAKSNKMLDWHLQRRFDRCLFHFPFQEHSDNGEVHIAEIIGNQAIDGLYWKKSAVSNVYPVFPSDHYGLFVVFGGPRPKLSESQVSSLEHNHEFQKKQKTSLAPKL